MNVSSMCYATSVKVTDENLKTAFEGFVASSANEDNYKISVSNNVITITSNDETYTINYDLTNNPTFTYKVPISNGMSYDNFKDATNNLSITMLGYLAVANIQGISYDDSSAYFAMCLLMYAFSNLSSSNSKYMIVSDGTTVENSDYTVIYESEFGNHVMEYVNSIYGTKQSFTDGEDVDGINSFTWTTEETDVTETSCNLQSTLTVNLDADFSKLNGYSNKMSDSFMNSDITEENADYVIKLKVGQKCNIESNEEITGYETSGSSCIEFNEDKTVITAISVGKANGYLYVGNSNTKKSFYVIVEENTSNQTLAPISITINTTSNTSSTNDPDTSSIQTNTSKEDNTISKITLPQTGSNETLFIVIIAIIAIITIIFRIKIKKYKDIK
jgi:LPXTG-motif cell wall-anchored protein